MSDDEKNNPVLMIALDATQHSLIKPWIDDGTLPNLKRVVDAGTYATLRSSVEWLAGTPWPTMLTSTWPNEHGHNGFMIWRPELMTYQRPGYDWLPWDPFYRRLSDKKRRVIAMDVPMTYPPIEFDGIELCSWSGHDKLWPVSSYPEAFGKGVFKKYGKAPLRPEVSGLEPPHALIQLQKDMMTATKSLGELNEKLIREEDWDLFISGFGGGHRGGHKFWDHTGVLGDVTPELEKVFSTALKDVYVEMDKQLGRLIDTALAKNPDTLVIAFALHGMGPSTSRFHHLPDMLDRILWDKHIDAEAAPVHEKKGLIKKLRELIPNEYRAAVKAKLPQAVQDALTKFWQKKHDWSQTKAMCAIGDLEGYIQVNLKGRERDGIVSPGEEYEALLDQICEGLMTFKDAKTGEPVVGRIGRGKDIYPGDGVKSMPDLVVVWTDSRATECEKIVSDKYGSILSPTPGRIPDGRAGHHLPVGWIAAMGPGIAPGADLGDRHILDLAPTVMKALGLEPFPEMRGAPIDVLLAKSGAPKDAEPHAQPAHANI